MSGIQNKKITLVLILLWGVSLANGSPEKLFSKANKALKAGKYTEAISSYKAAEQEKPESAEIQYNLGNAHYRVNAFFEAANYYAQAATFSKNPTVQSRAWYNIGNCLIRIGEEIPENKPNAALRFAQQALQFYQQALLSDPSFFDATHNLKVAQAMIGTLKSKIKKQNENAQKQSDFIQQIREKLKELIQQQTKLIKTNTQGDLQKQLIEETRVLAKEMEDSGLCVELPDLNPPLFGPLKLSFQHTQNAANAMENRKFPEAVGELQAALQALPPDPRQEKNNDEEEDSEESDENDSDSKMYKDGEKTDEFSMADELRGLPAPNRSEKDILNEEVRNNQRRKKKHSKQGQYKSVEKDW